MEFDFTTKNVIDKITISMDVEEFTIFVNAMKKAYPKVWAAACGKTGAFILKVKAIEEELAK